MNVSFMKRNDFLHFFSVALPHNVSVPVELLLVLDFFVFLVFKYFDSQFFDLLVKEMNCAIFNF